MQLTPARGSRTKAAVSRRSSCTGVRRGKGSPAVSWHWESLVSAAAAQACTAPACLDVALAVAPRAVGKAQRGGVQHHALLLQRQRVACDGAQGDGASRAPPISAGSKGQGAMARTRPSRPRRGAPHLHARPPPAPSSPAPGQPRAQTRSGPNSKQGAGRVACISAPSGSINCQLPTGPAAQRGPPAGPTPPPTPTAWRRSPVPASRQTPAQRPAHRADGMVWSSHARSQASQRRSLTAGPPRLGLRGHEVEVQPGRCAGLRPRQHRRGGLAAWPPVFVGRALGAVRRLEQVDHAVDLRRAHGERGGRSAGARVASAATGPATPAGS